MNRRKFIRNSFFSAVGLGLAGGLYSWQVEPFWLEYVRKKMPIRNPRDELIGKTLIQISDIHVGNRFNYQYLIDSFKEAQDLKPDFVVYTGDLSYENEEQINQLKEVMQHAITGTYGTAAVLGNHD